MRLRKLDDNELALRIIIYVLSLDIRKSEYIDDSEKSTYVYNSYFSSDKNAPRKGDVAIASTSGYLNLNEFTIGEIDEVIDGGLRIKDFKTGRLCDYKNEVFLCVKRDELGFKWKFGLERKIHDALLSKWREENSWYIFYKFSFENNHLRWSIREKLSNDEHAVVEFEVDDHMVAEQIVDKAFNIMMDKLKKEVSKNGNGL